MSNLAHSTDSSRLDLLARTIAKGATADELALFDGICQKTGLDPFTRQIYLVARWDSNLRAEVRAPQVSIDGMRLTAQRSGEYEGQTQAMWCGEDGVWKDIWLSSEPPAAARVGVFRAHFKETMYSTALWREYRQTKKDGTYSGLWGRMPSLMLAKCAEALALRKAFPAELSGLYTAEEMAQASSESPASPIIITPPALPVAATKPLPALTPKPIVVVAPKPEPVTVVPEATEPAQPILVLSDDSELIYIEPNARMSVVKNAAGTSVWKIERDGHDPLAVIDEDVATGIEANGAFSMTSRVRVVRRGKKQLVTEIVSSRDA